MLHWFYVALHLLVEANAARRDARVRFLNTQIEILRRKLGGIGQDLVVVHAGELPMAFSRCQGPRPTSSSKHYLRLDRKTSSKKTARAANKITATIGSGISAIIIRLPHAAGVLPDRMPPRLPEQRALGQRSGVLLSLTASQVRRPHRLGPCLGSN